MAIPIPDPLVEGFLPFTLVDLSVAARTAWGEARGELQSGQYAVLWVIKNRAEDKKQRWPTSIRGVCLQPYQFSCWNRADPNSYLLPKLTLSDKGFTDLTYKAFQVLLGLTNDPTFGCNHYHTKSSEPAWAADVKPVVQLGNHLFYKL